MAAGSMGSAQNASDASISVEKTTSKRQFFIKLSFRQILYMFFFH